MDIYIKKCDYCRNEVSVFESLTEFGKHFHQDCMIQKLNKELEAYKKKFLDGKMSVGDKVIFLDKFEFVKKLVSEPREEFKGWKSIQNRQRQQIKGEKVIMVGDDYLRTGSIPKGEDGKPQLVDSGEHSETSFTIIRPSTEKTTTPVTKKSLSGCSGQKKLTLDDVPRLMASI